jgi:hypothetical protein
VLTVTHIDTNAADTELLLSLDVDGAIAGSFSDQPLALDETHVIFPFVNVFARQCGWLGTRDDFDAERRHP